MIHTIFAPKYNRDNVMPFRAKRQIASAAVYLETYKFHDHFRYRVLLDSDRPAWSGHDYEDALELAKGLAAERGASIVHRVAR
jgi:hypothetical protein